MVIPQGSILSPAARDYLRSQGVQVTVEGEGLLDLDRQPLTTARHKPQHVALTDARTDAGWLPTGAGREKPEHMTHLVGDQLVAKTHPIIAWRGQLDLFDCALVETQALLAQSGEEELAQRLEEVALFAQKIMVAQVRNQPLEFTVLLGWTPEEIRDMSHHPDRYFGIRHTTMSFRDGLTVSRLNCLRAKVREVELYANRAFSSEDGTCQRTDIVLALNRLSSLFYILVCQQRSRQVKEKRVPIGVSSRHLHLSQDHLTALFGPGATLTIQKELSQPGQYAAIETVNLEGPKGKIDRVRVLGPVRPETQVEISATDAFKLGVRPVLRDSGKIDGSVGLRLVGPAGAVELDRGVIVAARHIHLHSKQAEEWNIHDGQRVKVKIDSQRPTVFDDVLVRVGPQFQDELHLDTDEANAALVTGAMQAVIEGA